MTKLTLRTILRRPSGEFRAGWRLLAFIGLVAALTFTTLLTLRTLGLDPKGPSPGASEPVAEFAAVAAAVAILLVALYGFLRRVERRGLATAGLSVRKSAVGEVVWGVVIGAAPVVLSVAILAVLGIAKVTPSPDALAARVSGEAWLNYAATTLGSAYEELLMRGYVLQLLVEGAGSWIAALLTGLIWATGHIGNPGSNAAGIVFTGMSGVLLAWVVIRTGSLWFAIGYHVAWNVVAAHILGLTTSGLDLGVSIWSTTLAGPELLTGGSYGFEGSILTEILDLVGLSTALLVARRWPRDAASLPYYAKRAVAEGAPSAGESPSPPPPSPPPPPAPPAEPLA